MDPTLHCSWKLRSGELVRANCSDVAERNQHSPEASTATFTPGSGDDIPCEISLLAGGKTPAGLLELRCNAKVCEVYVAGSYAGSVRAKLQGDGGQTLTIDLSQHAASGAAVLMRMLAMRPRGQLEVHSWAWTPRSEIHSPTQGGKQAAQSAGGSQADQVRSMLAALTPGASLSNTGPAASGSASAGGDFSAFATMMPGASAVTGGTSGAPFDPAANPMQSLMGAIAKGMMLKEQKDRIAAQAQGSTQQQADGSMLVQSSHGKDDRATAPALAEQHTMLERLLAAQEAQACRMIEMEQTLDALSATAIRLEQSQDRMQKDMSQLIAMNSAVLEAIIKASGTQGEGSAAVNTGRGHDEQRGQDEY